MAGRDRRSDEKPETTREDEGFLSRWSRRKADAKASEETAAADHVEFAEEPDKAATPTTQEAGEPPAFDVSTLPDIDSLGPGSDFSPFMQTGVPPALKTKALRKLWQVKPELANLDGLIDYGEDLTGSFKVVDHLKTAYEVGRGFLRDQADQATEDGEDKVAADADAGQSPEATDPESNEKNENEEENASKADESTTKA